MANLIAKTDNRRRALADRISRFSLDGAAGKTPAEEPVDNSKVQSAARVERIVRSAVRRAQGNSIVPA